MALRRAHGGSRLHKFNGLNQRSRLKYYFTLLYFKDIIAYLNKRGQLI
jgi:hypothetical protein